MKFVFLFLTAPAIIVFIYLPLIISERQTIDILKEMKYFLFNPLFMLFLIAPYLIRIKSYYLLLFPILGWGVLVIGIYWHTEILSYSFRGPEAAFILVLGFIHGIIYGLPVILQRLLISKVFTYIYGNKSNKTVHSTHTR